jgi:hypothetical protein
MGIIVPSAVNTANPKTYQGSATPMFVFWSCMRLRCPHTIRRAVSLFATLYLKKEN